MAVDPHVELAAQRPAPPDSPAAAAGRRPRPSRGLRRRDYGAMKSNTMTFDCSYAGSYEGAVVRWGSCGRLQSRFSEQTFQDLTDDQTKIHPIV